MRSEAREVALHDTFNLQRILVARARHMHHRAAISVEAHQHAILLERIGYVGEFAQCEMRAVFTRMYNNLFKRCFIKGASLGAHENLAIATTDGAAGNIHRRIAHRIGHGLQGELVFAQHLLGDFDTDFIVAKAAHHHA